MFDSLISLSVPFCVHCSCLHDSGYVFMSISVRGSGDDTGHQTVKHKAVRRGMALFSDASLCDLEPS